MNYSLIFYPLIPIIPSYAKWSPCLDADTVDINYAFRALHHRAVRGVLGYSYQVVEAPTDLTTLPPPQYQGAK